MKFQRFRNALACTLLFASSAASASDFDGIGKLLELTGVTTQMQSVRDLVTESASAHAARCDSVPISSSLPGFNSESVVFDIKSIFDRQNTARIEPIMDWYQSPLAEKIRTAEKSTVEPADIDRFLQTSIYKDDVRAALLKNIIDSTRVPEFVATLGTEIEYAGIVHSGCIEKAAVSGKPNREQILANITRNDKELTAALLYTDIADETAYYFRNLTTAELAQYANFTSSENAQLFYSNLISAVQGSLTLAGDRTSMMQNSSQYSLIDF